MRWARGLFRLWLLFSILWIGGAGTLTWLAPTLAFPVRHMTPEEIVKCNSNQNPTQSADSFFESYELCRKQYETFFNDNVSINELIFAVRGEYLLIWLGVPITILLIGIAFRWVLAGFR